MKPLIYVETTIPSYYCDARPELATPRLITPHLILPWESPS